MPGICGMWTKFWPGCCTSLRTVASRAEVDAHFSYRCDNSSSSLLELYNLKPGILYKPVVQQGVLHNLFVFSGQSIHNPYMIELNFVIKFYSCFILLNSLYCISVVSHRFLFIDILVDARQHFSPRACLEQLHGNGPSFTCQCLQFIPVSSLAGRRDLYGRLPAPISLFLWRACRSTGGHREFPVAGTVVWNCRPIAT